MVFPQELRTLILRKAKASVPTEAFLFLIASARLRENDLTAGDEFFARDLTCICQGTILNAPS